MRRGRILTIALQALGFVLGLSLALWLLPAQARSPSLPPLPAPPLPSLDTSRLLSPEAARPRDPRPVRTGRSLPKVRVPRIQSPPKPIPQTRTLAPKPTQPALLPNPGDTAATRSNPSTSPTALQAEVGRSLTIEPDPLAGSDDLPVVLMERSSGNRITITPGQGIQIESPRSRAADLLLVPAAPPKPPIPSGRVERMLYPLPVVVPITSPFGLRIHPITGQQEFHQGVDLGAGAGTPILAAFSGEVLVAGPLGGLGNAVSLAHGPGQRTRYGHMASVTVTVGQQVKQGTVIGYVGSTGESTGPHLHFELWQRAAGVDWTALDSADQLKVAVAQLPR